jgi:hypothetical protein
MASDNQAAEQQRQHTANQEKYAAELRRQQKELAEIIERQQPE